MPHPLAKHYLEIYRVRLRMGEDGVTQPTPAVLEWVRALAAALERLDSVGLP